MKNEDDSSSSTDCQIYSELESEFVVREEQTENWKDYLAPEDEDGNQIQFKLKFPDNTSDQISFPANSQVKVSIHTQFS